MFFAGVGANCGALVRIGTLSLNRTFVWCDASQAFGTQFPKSSSLPTKTPHPPPPAVLLYIINDN